MQSTGNPNCYTPQLSPATAVSITKLILNGVEYVVRAGKTVIDGVEYVVEGGKIIVSGSNQITGWIRDGVETAARATLIGLTEVARQGICSEPHGQVITAAVLGTFVGLATASLGVGFAAGVLTGYWIYQACKNITASSSPQSQTAALVTAIPAPQNIVALCLDAGEFVVAVAFDQVVDPENRDVLYLVEGIEATPQVIKGSPYTSFDTFTGESTSVRLEVLFSGAAGASYSVTMKTRIGDQDSEASEAVAVACPAASG